VGFAIIVEGSNNSYAGGELTERGPEFVFVQQNYTFV